MITYNIIKKLTNDYSNIDKEMFYRSLFNIYKNKDIEIDLSQIGIPEHIYVSLFDLPLIEIKNGTFDELTSHLQEKFDSNINIDVDELSTAIFSSINNFFLLRKDKNFYFCHMNKNFYLFKFTHIPIKSFIQLYRKQILLKLEI